MIDPAQPKHHDLDKAFRHGYIQGVAAAIAALQHKFSEEERLRLDRWLQYELSPWSQFQGVENTLPAPEFPPLHRPAAFELKQAGRPGLAL